MKFIRPINKGGRWGLRLFKWFGPPILALGRAIQQPSAMYVQELLYERLFSGGLSRLGLENRYYPTGGAANFSLMYILLRTITELPVRRVVELGCGQTTLLFDALTELRDIEITTLEHDRDWAGRIQEQVKHRITCAELVKRSVQGHNTLVYDTEVNSGVSPDLLLVDGPLGGSRRSRWAALQWIEQGLGENFLILFDDAERRGEIDTIEEALKLLRDQGRTFRTRFFYGVKWQFAIAAGRLAPATHY